MHKLRDHKTKWRLFVQFKSTRPKIKWAQEGPYLATKHLLRVCTWVGQPQLTQTEILSSLLNVVFNPNKHAPKSFYMYPFYSVNLISLTCPLLNQRCKWRNKGPPCFAPFTKPSLYPFFVLSSAWINIHYPFSRPLSSFSHLIKKGNKKADKTSFIYSKWQPMQKQKRGPSEGCFSLHFYLNNVHFPFFSRPLSSFSHLIKRETRQQIK